MIDVVPAQDGEVIREQLQGDDVDQRLQAVAHLGNLDDHVFVRGEFVQRIIVFADDQDAARVASAKLLDDGLLLEVGGIARGDDDQRKGLVDQRQRTVFHLTCQDAFRVKKGDFFHLQGAFEGGGVVVTPTE